jgi:trehalose synthase
MLPGVVALRDVDVPEVPLEQLRPLIGDARADHLLAVAAESRELLRGRTVFNVNSTSAGGGVAEMLQVLVGYTRGAGVATRWLVIEGDPEFFAITKRIHNRIHGVAGDEGALGPAEASHYRDVTEANAAAMVPLLGGGDVVLLHDPQTAGMARRLVAAGAKVVWRCHIGAERPDRFSEQAWEFLRPHVSAAQAFVFSRQAYAPSWLPREAVSVIPPSIDPFSPKNQDLPASAIPSFLDRIGLTEGHGREIAAFTRRDGTPGVVFRAARVIADGPVPLDRPFAVQVSRWDRLKDMPGVMTGFATQVAGRLDAHLALVGPSVEGVADDPEGAQVFEECIAGWEALPPAVRGKVHLVALPMNDIDENAAMVNAIQRAANVVVQKSLMEGFGLTVTEGMWKAKPVIGSRVGGISDQIAPGTGLLLDDPDDLAGFGQLLGGLLADPAEASRMGSAARRHVLDEFVGDRHLLQYADLMKRLLR